MYQAWTDLVLTDRGTNLSLVKVDCFWIVHTVMEIMRTFCVSYVCMEIYIWIVDAT